MNREALLIKKILEASEAIKQTQIDLSSFRTLQISETEAIPRRLGSLRTEATFVERRERDAQEVYRKRKEEIDQWA